MLDMQDLETLRYTLMNIDNFPYCFYGMYTRFGMKMSMDGCLQIALAKVTEEGAQMKGKVVKGVAKYEKDQLWFTLNQNECNHLLKNLNEVISDKYVNPDDTVKEDYKKTFSFTHFNTDKKPSHIIFEADKRDNKPTGNLKVTIRPVKDSGKEPLSFIISNNAIKKVYERDTFINFLKNVVTSGVYDTMYIKTSACVYREALRQKIDDWKKYLDEKENGKGGKNKEETPNKKSNYVEDVTGLGNSNNDTYQIDDITGVTDINPDDDIPF